MQNWTDASAFEKTQFEAISGFLIHRSYLIDFIFNPSQPRLNDSPEKIIFYSSDFCTSDQILIKLALNLWCGYGSLRIQEIFYLDAAVFFNVLKAFEILGPKPDRSFDILQKLSNKNNFITEF